jgi:hypothetical protein
VVERNTACIKTLNQDWIQIGIQPKMLDPEPYQMTTDLKYWSILLVVERNTPSMSILLGGEGLFLLFDVENSHVNAE